MSDLIRSLTAQVQAAFGLEEITPAAYRQLQYPRLLPMMKFSVRQYRVPGFGHLMTMHTDGMGGVMQLDTVVLTPGAGAAVPFLLIDTMEMKAKKLAYVEYYDCTAAGAVLPGAAGQKAEFAALPDYAEKPAWYIARRTPYSLIKGGKDADGAALQAMVTACVERYLAAAAAAEKSGENLAGLTALRDDLRDRGNPASGTLEKVLGPAQAKQFFDEVIMKIAD